MSSVIKEEQKPVDRRKFLRTATVAGAGLLALAASRTENKLAHAAGKAKGPRYAMFVDLKRCIGCRACSVACKSENEVPLKVFRTTVHYLDTGKYPNAKRYLARVLCNHCSNPPCVKACPVKPIKAAYTRPDGIKVTYEKKATYQRPDGTVLVDYDRCIGCHMCVLKCPYKARFVDPVKKAGGNPGRNTVGKCTFCNHRIDKSVVPSCVQTCVGGALTFGDINDPSGKVSKMLKKNETQVWKPEKGTKPNVYYAYLTNKAVLGKGVKSI